MQWLANNYQWLIAVVVIPVLGFLLKRYIFTESPKSAEIRDTSSTVSVRDSRLTGSPVASGSQITQHNYFSPATPQPVMPIPATTAPTAEAKPSPNMRFTRTRVFPVNEYAPVHFSEDQTGKAQAVVVEFTNEARHGKPNKGVTVKASLVYEHDDTGVLRIIGAWMHSDFDVKTFNVEDTYQLVVGIFFDKQFTAIGMITSGGYVRTDPCVLPTFETVRIRLTNANNGDLLYEGRFRVTFDPLGIVPDITGQGDVTLSRST